MNKHVKPSIDYYLRYIDSEAYKDAKRKAENNNKTLVEEYIRKEKPQWKNRTDCFEDGRISMVTICDTLSNEGVAKLVKRLHTLPRKSFKVKNYLNKPTAIRKYDYVHLQYSHTQTALLAEIGLLSDKYIKTIVITWTQLNSYFAVIQYDFHFRQPLDDNNYVSFMQENIIKLSSKDFIIWYPLIKSKKQALDEPLLTQMNQDYFPLLIQHYITTYLYSEQGKKHPLVNITTYTREKPFDIHSLYLEDLGVSYYNKKEHYVISTDFDETNFVLLADNNRIPHISIVGFIAKYGKEFYYHFCGLRELKIFEEEFSKFSSGRKKISYNHKFMTLLNKFQSLIEYSPSTGNDFYKHFNSNWDFYLCNDKENFKDFNHKYRKTNYQKIYQDNYSYLKILSEINYTKSNQRIAVIATIASVIAVLISLITLVA